MGRKCTVCQHPDKAEIDRKIIANDGSPSAIGCLFGLSKDSISRHRSHLKIEIRNAQVVRGTSFYELTKAIERLITKVEKHLSISAKSEIWFKESRELRNWVALRAKLAGKFVKDEAGGTPKGDGDSYNLIFVSPDGQQAKIPLAVYSRLKVNEKESVSLEQCGNTSKLSDSNDETCKVVPSASVTTT
jgi:hypothetical protein